MEPYPLAFQSACVEKKSIMCSWSELIAFETSDVDGCCVWIFVLTNFFCKTSVRGSLDEQMRFIKTHVLHTYKRQRAILLNASVTKTA